MTIASVVPDHETRTPAHHMVALRVENKAGVLVRIAGLFSRRAFNIFSLAVAPTDDPRFSRISIVVDAESAPLEQVLSQLSKLINVVEIHELAPDDAREAELLLVTVNITDNNKAELVELVQGAGGEIAEETSTQATVMVSGDPVVLDGVEKAIGRFGIVDLQRTGRIALPKLRPAN